MIFISATIGKIIVVTNVTITNAEYKLESINQNLYTIKIIANQIAPLLFIAHQINHVWALDKWSNDAQINVPTSLEIIATNSKTTTNNILRLNTSKLKFIHIFTKKNGTNNKLEKYSTLSIILHFLHNLFANMAHNIKANKDQTTNIISLGLNFHNNKVIPTKANIQTISSIMPDSSIIVHTLVFNLFNQNKTSAVVHSAVILKHIHIIIDICNEYHNNNNTPAHKTKGTKNQNILI